MKSKLRLVYYIIFCWGAISLFLAQNAQSQQNKYPTREIESYYDLNFSSAERDSLFAGLQDYQKSIEAIHQYPLNNSVGMSLIFDPVPPGFTAESKQGPN